MGASLTDDGSAGATVVDSEINDQDFHCLEPGGVQVFRYDDTDKPFT